MISGFIFQRYPDLRKAIGIIPIAILLLQPLEGKETKKDTIIDPLKLPRRVYFATRLIKDKPVIDGHLNDECWKTGEWTGNYTQWTPKEGAKPSQQTQFKILYDEKYLYVAIKCFDNEPDKISRKAGKRDEILGDVVGITFDSYHDHRTGFEFDVTSTGQKIDLMVTNPNNPEFNWNAVWSAKAAIEDSAWCVEMQIPFSQLRYSNDTDQVWGLHSWRWIDRYQEESDWDPQSSKGPGLLYLFGELKGISGLPKSRRIEIMPYILGQLSTFEKDPQNLFALSGRNWTNKIGGDAKIGLSSNFTADVTINPDFGQVESDPSVMNISAFETYYEEKRPFFIEGKNIYNFDFDNVNFFYSRRIGHSPSYSPTLKTNQYIDEPGQTTILNAIKISGKSANGFSLGVLQSLTANEFATIDSVGQQRKIKVEPFTSYSLIRVQQDYGQGNSYLGGIFTTTNRWFNESYLNFLSRNAYTAGFDFFHQWHDKKFYIDLKLVGSDIQGSPTAIKSLQLSSARYYQRPDIKYIHYDTLLTQLSGNGGRLIIGKGTGLWRYSMETDWRSPGLELNDLGFMQTVDIIKEFSLLSYFINHPVGCFRTYNFAVGEISSWDYGHRPLSSIVGVSAYLEFINKWAISNTLLYTFQSLDPRILRGGPAMVVPGVFNNSFFFRTDPSKKWYFDLQSNINLSDNQRLKYISVQPEMTIMPLNLLKLTLSVNYTRNFDQLQYVVDTTSLINNSINYVLGTISQNTLGLTFRIDCNLTKNLSLQYYGSPFVSIGHYYNFKQITHPLASDYNQRFEIMNPNLYDGTYIVNSQNAQMAYSFTNPDFTFSQFRSNLVLRWEYRPGSQFYLVWSQDRSNYQNPYYESMGQSVQSIKSIFPNNYFLIKFNYWFSL